ncbi:efflux RND transporter periplasmic adaptor subunit [Pelagibius sp. CAU 1746]|uniref:efflux RND transporter periplasmic adaptor subunit n=1 Tax=Pelagibius sp. CAU 1746 TaxID=3140370 RepID=UPI00325AC7DE
MKRGIVRSLMALLVLAALGLAVFLFVYLRPLQVEVSLPAENVPVEVFGLGTVEARILSKVGFETGAALAALNADHGDRVKKGDVLARLQSTEQEARVAKARAGIANAEAAVRMAEAAVGKARAVLTQKKQANRRKQALVARQTVSVEVAEEAQMEEDVAAAELAVAVSDVEVTKAALDDAKAQYELERVLLDKHVLIAPYDAVVVERHKELGAVLAAGETLFTLVAAETVWVLAYVDEARAGGLRLDQPAEVRLRSLPRQTFRGHVARIAIESDRVSEERRVYIACDLCPQSFHLGEQAEVFIRTATLDNPLLVPEAAVDGFDGLQGSVWTVEDGELRRRNVTFGERTLDSRLEIVDGLPGAVPVVRVLRPGLREGRAAAVKQGGAP